MPTITNAGTYRGTVLEHAVSESTNGYPQLVLKMSGTQYYDETNKEWVELQDIPDSWAYLILADSKDEKTLNCVQVEKAFNWDGLDLTELESMKLDGKPIQFRASFRKYNNEDRLGVEWIDEYNAEPGRSVKKLDATSLKVLQSKFNKVSGGKLKTTPASAPKTTLKKTAPIVPTRQPTKPKVETTSGGKCTQAEAFEFVSNKELWKKDITEKVVADTWLKVVNEIAGERPDGEITPEEWFTIREKVAQEIFVF
jgi:hypothetical protein